MSRGTGWLTRASLLGLALASATGCASARRGEPLRGPLVLDERAQRGRAVFLRQCHACHPGGEGGLAPAINNKPLPKFLKRFQVRHGLGAMPAIPEAVLSNEELSDLIAYLERLRHHGTPPDR